MDSPTLFNSQKEKGREEREKCRYGKGYDAIGREKYREMIYEGVHMSSLNA